MKDLLKDMQHGKRALMSVASSEIPAQATFPYSMIRVLYSSIYFFSFQLDLDVFYYSGLIKQQNNKSSIPLEQFLRSFFHFYLFKKGGCQFLVKECA